jgi:hypothetical protein
MGSTKFNTGESISLFGSKMQDDGYYYDLESFFKHAQHKAKIPPARPPLFVTVSPHSSFHQTTFSPSPIFYKNDT